MSKLRAEFLLCFVLLPLALAFIGSPRTTWIFFLWGGAMLAGYWLHVKRGVSFRREWNWRAVRWTNMRPLLLRFAFGVIVLFMLLLTAHPGWLFNFPLTRPDRWALVMLLYPLLSVFPQEYLFRSFFFARYAALWKGGAMVWASALAFGFVHVIMQNAVAVGMSALGGLLFADTYRRHRSLALVSIEHALYGCALFTLGWGLYFYRPV